MRKTRINEEDETAKIIVKMGRGDNYKYNYDVDYNDDECEDMVREMKIGQEDEENEDNEEDETEVTSEDRERR